jgi:hypothetical protein
MDWSNASADEIDRGFDHFGGLQSAAAAHLCDLIQAADVAQVWMRDGAKSLIEWVSVKLRVRHATARQLVAVSGRLMDLPFLSAGFACGDLSLDQVDAISTMATPDTEEDLIEEALRLSNHELDRKARNDAPPSRDDEGTVWERRRLVRQWNLDESELKLWGNLPAAEGQIFDRAIDDRIDQVPMNPETGTFDSLDTRSADALVELAATSGGEESRPPQMTVFADLNALTTEGEGLTELESGALVPNETARRLSCDAVVETAVMEEDIVVGVGRNRRTIPGWLRRLVHARAGGCCQYPGCASRRWLQVHHKQHWADGGTTDLDNLVLICGFHHRFVHEHGWHITGPADKPIFRRPDWTIYPRLPDPLDPRLAAVARPI